MMRHMSRLARFLIAVAAALVLTSCSDGSSLPPLPDDPASTLGVAAGRPASVRVPSDYDPNVEYPLVILLHGYSASGGVQNIYFGLSNQVTALGFILVVPDGTVTSEGARCWNATDACCNFDTDDGDDVGSLRGLIAEAQANYRVDPRRVYLFGHSNGGFMAHRMACEASDLVSSVVSLAGSTFVDDASCAPTTYPVSVLAMHGDADDTVLYDGNQFYPGASETIRRFAVHAGCDTSNPAIAPNIDVVGSIAGAETTVLQYSGCPEGVDVDFWTLVGAPHIPGPWVASALDSMVNWMLGHRRE